MINELITLGLQKREGKIDISWPELGAKFGLDGEVARDKVRKYEKKHGIVRNAVKQTTVALPQDLPSYKETIELNKDGSQVSDRLLQMSAEQAKDVDYLLKAHGYSERDWELTSARNNIWNVYSQKDGVQTLYSSKITVKPRTSSISMDELKEHFVTFSTSYTPPCHLPIRYDAKGKMLEVNIADTHVGKLCWYGETGESYDYRIAKARFLHVINDIISRTQHYQFEKILLVWSNDFFHFDNIDSATTKGTRQDTDMRWQKLYLKGIEILVEAVDLLSAVAPVETFYIGSNHDKTTSYYAINYLHAWYRNNPYVSVDIDPKSRKYVEFGKCLIGFAHGDSERKRIAGLMPTEAREAWGRTLWHEIHMGHLHSEQVREENNIIIRNVSSITATDSWHYESGYIGAVRKAQSFIWDREYGLTDIIHSVITA